MFNNRFNNTSLGGILKYLARALTRNYYLMEKPSNAKPRERGVISKTLKRFVFYHQLQNNNG